MVVVVEVSRPWVWKPRRFASVLGGRRYCRVWWMYFAVAWWPGDMVEFGDAIRRGEWRTN